jgi:NAD(P)-dependent dehydrogenase (short-subunit alcohol dehydrogenase family)
VREQVRIAVIDGQGGGIGKHITEKLRKDLPEGAEIIALGTNALATAVMLRAGANEGASGENAVVFNAEMVDLIVGSISIIVPNSMLGELTPEMARAIVRSQAPKVLLPLIPGRIAIVGLKSEPLPHLIDELVRKVREMLSR